MQVVYGWVSRNQSLKGRKGQQGFTLIELLVVVTILGILAAIVTLSLVGLTTNANVQSCNTEYKTVQAALDAAMAQNNLGTITPTALNTPTNNMQTVIGQTSLATPVALYNANPSASNPNYTRNGTTQFWYQWNQFGKITAISTDANAAHTLGGCNVLS
jgi:prepilin-type N-terminal cleavage/methylation domain-containing protein